MVWSTPETITSWGAAGAVCPKSMVCVGPVYSNIASTCVFEKVGRCVAPNLNWHLLAFGFIFAAFDAFGIGSNDVANSFATSVASGSLSLRQAMGIAFFTEIIGAVFLGAAVTDTIKGSIVNLAAFKNQPDVLMLGMVCAIIASSSWVNFASYTGYPVSTTHAIVGAMIGIGMGFRGNQSTKWPSEDISKFVVSDPTTIIKFDSLGGILLSFAFSPLIAAFFGCIIFSITKFGIMRRANPYKWALYTSPAWVFGTWLLIAFFMVYKGAPGLNLAALPLDTVLGISFGIGGAAAATAAMVGIPILKRQIEAIPLPWGLERIPQSFGITLLEKPVEADDVPYMEWCKALDAKKEIEETKQSDNGEIIYIPVAPQRPTLRKRVMEVLMWGVNQDVRTHNVDNQPWHDEAEKFDERAERVFGFLQVMTAAFSSLSHGGNDVSNAIAPFCVIIEIYNSGFNNLANKTASKVPVPMWVLAYGGAWISIGLFCYGFNIMRSLGNNLTYHSPSRGFSMELGALTTVLAATKLGLPVSTTHCITGSTVGVGLANGTLKSVNWRMFAIACFGWLFTLPITALFSALLFMFISYSPHKLEQNLLPAIVI